MAESDMPRNVDRICCGDGGHCMPSRSLDLNPMDFFFLWRHMKEQLDEVPIRTTEDLLAEYQVAVTTDDSNVLETRRRDWRLSIVCLPMNTGRFEHQL
jgi:hypothetical protein